MGNTLPRNDHRFYAAFPLKVRSPYLAAPVETSTINVGASGLYFALPEELPLGSEIACELIVAVPSAGNSVPLHFSARVVRVEQCHGRVGIAVEFLREQSRVLWNKDTAA